MAHGQGLAAPTTEWGHSGVNERRRQRVEELFGQAAELDPDARAAFLERACEGDQELRREVASLLAHDAADGDPFSEGRLGLGQELLADAVFRGTTANILPEGASSPAPLPEQIGHYRVLEKIGEGGMGTVYLAEQSHPHRRVALKMIRAGVLSRGLLRRFQQEAELLGRLQHPGIAQIYEAGAIDTEAGPQPYFAMEYVDGVELRRYAKQHNLGTREQLELVARICDAVHHAHQKGIIHRDLKPDNVLVIEGPSPAVAGGGAESALLGQPKVLDFGVARATDCDVQVTTLQTDIGQLIGTVPYMSPEQVAGDSRLLDTRSDIYALGVILYELLSRRLPYDLRQKSIPEAARIIREEEPTRLSSISTMFRGDIDTIVGRTLEKDRERRYQSAAGLAADIRRSLASEPIVAHPPSTFYQLRKFAKRHTGLVAGLVLSFVILLAGTVTSLTFGVRAVREGKRAGQNEQLAKANEKRALLSEAAARRAAYRLSVTAADAVGDTDPLQALRHLQAAPSEYRGWEWRHLLARFGSHRVAYTGDRFTDYASTIARRDDGALVAALERDNAIVLVDLESGEVWRVFREKGGLTTPNVSPDGSRLAAVSSAEQKLITWDVATRKRLLEVPIRSVDAPHTRFSPDGSLIGLVSREDGLEVRETATGRVRFHIPGSWGYDDITEFDSDGVRIAFVDQFPGGHFSLNVVSATGQQLASQNFMDGCASLAFSPDGRRLAVGQQQRKILVLDASTLAVLDVLYGHAGSITALAFSVDGAYLASSSTDGTTRIWDSSGGETLRVLVGGDATSLAFAQDNTVLAAGSSAAARLWAGTYDAHLVLRGHERYVYLVTFSPDPGGLSGRPGAPGLIASSAWDNTVRLWDALTGEPLGILEATRCYHASSFTPDGARLIATDVPGLITTGTPTLAVWDSATGLRLSAPRTASDEAIFETIQRGDSNWWLCYGRVAAGGAKCVHGLGEDWATSRDRSLTAIGSEHGDICITDLATGSTIKCVGNHDSRVFAVAFSPDADRVVSGGEDDTVRVWDVASGAELATMNGHTGSVYSVDYNPDGTRIVSGSNDRTIRIWDAETFDQVAVLRGHESYVHSVCFSPDGTMLASGSGDGTVRIWDSLPTAERWRQIQQAKDLRRGAEPLVDHLLAELGDPLEVADHLRADESLGEDLRRAALHVLLKRAAAERSRE